MFTTAKSPLVICAAISVSATSPALISVICWAVLEVLNCCAANTSEVGDSVSVAGFVPVPVRAATCVPTLSTTVSVPERAPDAVGANTIARVHPVPAAREAVQVFPAIAKSPSSDRHLQRRRSAAGV